jgi:hypothetical protein
MMLNEQNAGTKKRRIEYIRLAQFFGTGIRKLLGFVATLRFYGGAT